MMQANICWNKRLLCQDFAGAIFPELKYRTWVIPYEKQANPVLYEVRDSSVLVTLATTERLYNKGKYKLSNLNIKEIYEIKYAKKGRGYWVLIGGVSGLALGAAISAAYLNTHKTTTLDEASVNGGVYMLTMILSTGAGLGIGALIKGGKTTLLLQGSQTKYDLYKNRLNELALRENQTRAVTDTDGNKYNTGCFCGKEWMKENLEVTRYRNGDGINQVKDAAAWENMQEGALCLYNKDSSDRNSQGMLYNGNAIYDPRGLCPDGWHLPSYQEWSDLISCFSFGKVIPEEPRPAWLKPVKNDSTNLILQDQYDFALPAGYRDKTGNFSADHSNSQWWTSTLQDSASSKALFLRKQEKGIFFTSTDKKTGLSVRCVRD